MTEQEQQQEQHEEEEIIKEILELQRDKLHGLNKEELQEVRKVMTNDLGYCECGDSLGEIGEENGDFVRIVFKMKWKVICINNGIEETQETEDLNKFFENAGIDEEEYGEDRFIIKRIN